MSIEQDRARQSVPVRASGFALIAAGLCYLPLGTLDGWQGIPAVGTSIWWLVETLATGHHLFFLFGVFGLYAAAIRRPGASGLGAFVATGTGNLLATGNGAIQLTILPALAAHPDASAALDCTPFYTPATRAATAFVEQACTAWQFGALDAWVTIAWLVLSLGSLWLAVELFRAAFVPRTAAVLVGVGSILRLAAVGVTLPGIVSDTAWLAIAAGLGWCGVVLAGARPGNARTPG